MLDDNWELISGEVAHEIEVLNLANQVNVIEAVVKFLIHHHGFDEVTGGSKGCPNEMALKEFHRTATFLLLEQPGQYREVAVHLKTETGTIAYVPPIHETVPKHMNDFFRNISETS